MIASDMKRYTVLQLGAMSGYGSSTVDFENPVGTVELALYVTDFDTQQNIVFSSSSYVGVMGAIDINIRPDIQGADETTLLPGGHFIIADVPDKAEPVVLKVNAVYRKGRHHQIFFSTSSYKIPDDFVGLVAEE